MTNGPYIPVSFDPTPSVSIPPKNRHGGRRAGAGSKPGNLNALKTGLHSPRLYRAALLIAVIPDLRLLFETLIREDEREARKRYRDIFAVANHAIQHDPDLANSIKHLLVKRLREASARIPGKSALLEILLKQSNHQDPYIPILEELRLRELRHQATEHNPDA